MKKNLVLGFVLFLSVIPFIVATSTPYSQDTVKIRVTLLGNAAEGNTLNLKVDFESGNFDFNDESFSFDLTNSNNTVWDSPDFEYVIFSNTTAINLDYFELWNETDRQLTTCKIQRGQFETSWNQCLDDLADYEGENASQCKEELSACNLKISEKDLQISSKDEKISTLEEDKDSTKNSKWIYGLIGAVLGGAAFHFYTTGKKGGKVRDKSVDEWSKSQAG